MTFELALAAAAFCFAGALTPGPNNVMLLASGVNFGFARTVPHMVGVVLGYAFLLLVIGMGLGQTVVEHPVAFQTLRIIGALYMIWLAWKIATARVATMTLPPPTAISRSAPAAAAAALANTTEA